MPTARTAIGLPQATEIVAPTQHPVTWERVTVMRTLIVQGLWSAGTTIALGVGTRLVATKMIAV